MEMMMAVRKLTAAPGFEYVETPLPKMGPDDLLVKVRATSMCGTDIHIYNWEPPWSQGRFVPPKTIGHEVCGEVIDTGVGATTFHPGDLVSAESHIPDWTCSQCQRGNMHICEHLKFFSIDTDGFWAEYAVIPATNAWKNPKTMKPETLTLQESMGNSVYTVMESHVEGKTVAIFGLGPTGLFATAIAKAMGAEKVIGIAGTAIHLRIAQQMGADRRINRHEEDVKKALLDETGGNGPDVVLEMSGSEQALQQAVEVVRPVGQVTVLGLPTKPLTLDISKHIVLKDLTFRGIYGRKMWETWETTAALLKSGRINIEPVITHRLALEDFEKGITAMKSGQSGKVVMRPP